MNRAWPILLIALSACGTGVEHSETSVKLEGETTDPGEGEILGIVVTPDEVIVPVGSTIRARGARAEHRAPDRRPDRCSPLEQQRSIDRLGQQ